MHSDFNFGGRDGQGSELNRRQWLGRFLGGVALTGMSGASFGAGESLRKRMGITAASYSRRWRETTSDGALPALEDARGFVEHARRLGAGGVQVSVNHWAPEESRALREACEASGMFLEGQIRLPKSGPDEDRFAREIRSAREAGARVVRTVALGSRRYETFDSAEAFRAFKKESWESLVRAERVVRGEKVVLAVENHKDWRIPELLEILEGLSSEFIRVCVDTGNSISLLEDPMEVVEAYAPWAATSHFKDMGVRENEDGFLLSEVPLGEGMLDLPRIISVLSKANPSIQFNLEMITRDPLRVPCLDDEYWATFADVPGRDLARTLRLARAQASTGSLPRVSGMTLDERLRFEEENVRKSFQHASTELGLR